MSALLATSLALVLAQVPVGADPADGDADAVQIADEAEARLTSGERLRLVADGAGLALFGSVAVTWPLFAASTLPWILFPYFEAVISRLMPVGLEPILATYAMASIGTLGVVVLTAVALAIALEVDPIFFVLAGAPTLATFVAVFCGVALVGVFGVFSVALSEGGSPAPPWLAIPIVTGAALAIVSGLLAAPLIPLSLLLVSVPADEVSPADDFGLTTLRRWVILHARRETEAIDAE